MNADRERTVLEAAKRNPFWVCLVVFLALAVDSGWRFSRQIEQRGQLNQAQLNQAANIGRLASVLAQTPQVETKLQNLSLDLIRVARTNAAAAQLVREFNIQWTPGSESAAPAGVAGATNAAVAPVTNPVKK